MPAGGLSPGQTPEEVARRELSEEIGGKAGDLHYVGQPYTFSKISSGEAYVYPSTGVELDETHRELTGFRRVPFLEFCARLGRARSRTAPWRWRYSGVSRH